MNMRRRVQRNRINVRKLLIHSKGRTSYVPKHQIYRQMWKMNKYDSDNWPSVPHAHSFSGKQKMDVWTGEVFDAQTHKHVGNARKKEVGMRNTPPLLENDPCLYENDRNADTLRQKNHLVHLILNRPPGRLTGRYIFENYTT